VRGMAVHDQVDRAGGVGEQLLTELDEPCSGEAAGVGGKPCRRRVNTEQVPTTEN
jgi:hypothetical protein